MYGGRELVIIELIEQRLRVIQTLEFRDWISSVQIYDEIIAGDILEFCVLTSHSVAYRIEADLQKATWRTVATCRCVEKSTLYCSRIIGRRWSDTTILGGTALGELIIWTVGVEDTPRKVLQRQFGHNVSNTHILFVASQLMCNFPFFLLWAGRDIFHRHQFELQSDYDDIR